MTREMRGHAGRPTGTGVTGAVVVARGGRSVSTEPATPAQLACCGWSRSPGPSGTPCPGAGSWCAPALPAPGVEPRGGLPRALSDVS